MPHVQIHAAELLKHDTFVILNLLRLIMHLVAFSEAITRQHASEAHHWPKILGQLSNGVRG
jgi:hypothetical protein